MRITDFAKYSGAFLALAACAACGGQAATPSTAALDASLTAPLPGRHASSNSFAYIVNNYGSYADIFNYPKSDKQIGSIGDVGGQACTNVLYGYGKKTFWIVAGENQISEYQVPKKLIKTLSVSVGMPSGCAMNTNGDLAVGIFNGDLVIFAHATGTGTVVTTSLAHAYFLGFDDKGNLFADGVNDSDNFGLVELPVGTSKTRPITTSNAVGFPSSVQWDGTYLSITDMYRGFMYRYTIAGTKAKLKGTTTLKGAASCTQTWIVTNFVLCADDGNNDGEVYDYPAGGSSIAVLKGNFEEPLGTVAVMK